MTPIFNMWFNALIKPPFELLAFLLILVALNGYILSKSWKRKITYPIAIIQIPTVWIFDIWYFHKVLGYLTYDWDSGISLYTVPLIWISLPVINGMIVWIVNRLRKNKRNKV
jgi:hypothetical protein